MRLTPLKVLIESYTPDDIEKLQRYHQQVENTSDDIVRNSIEKPDIAPAEYKIKSYNLDNYILDSWSTGWDKERDCPIIIVVWFHIHLGVLTAMNVQMKESEWKELLLTLGYT